MKKLVYTTDELKAFFDRYFDQEKLKKLTPREKNEIENYFLLYWDERNFYAARLQTLRKYKNLVKEQYKTLK